MRRPGGTRVLQAQRSRSGHSPGENREAEGDLNRKASRMAGDFRLVDYRTQLSNFYASSTRLVRLAEYLGKRGITLPVQNGQDSD